ncbi:S-adenosyl-L-methionine-dependent methyltransferase [Xylaria grammica]|nr:S-adenosyl-L-methionine-dependent methyltransferase [Xylaria grammica]
MPNPLEDVKARLAMASGASRRDLLTQLNELIVSIETTEETVERISLYPLQTSVAKIGQDLGIFGLLTNSGPQSLEQLQVLTKAHPRTLGRLLRYMASLGLIGEAGINLFEANETCRKLATPEGVITLTHFWDNGMPLWQIIPEFLRKHNYQDVTDGRATVFHSAFKTDEELYEWFHQNPVHQESSFKFMALQKATRGVWFDKFPIPREARSWDPNMPVWVDIGGNVGHYCRLFKERFPEVPGRVILQDIPLTIEKALRTPGVENMSHDFFEEQPIKAMTAESVLLINDMVVLDSKVPAWAAFLDIMMMAFCGAQERTTKEWADLLGGAGLSVKECTVYDTEQCLSIISATL